MPCLRALRDAEQFYAEAEFVRGGEIGERDLLDALDRDGVGVDAGAERQRGEDGELVRGVETADVESRVGFGVAKPLRFGEADGERKLFLFHARQDVIAGAVEDAGDAPHRIARQTFAKRLDDRHAAADGGLEGERRAVPLGKPSEFDAMRREHRLVGGDDGQGRATAPRAPHHGRRRPRRRSARRTGRFRRSPRARRGSAKKRASPRSTPRSRSARALTADDVDVTAGANLEIGADATKQADQR